MQSSDCTCTNGLRTVRLQQQTNTSHGRLSAAVYAASSSTRMPVTPAPNRPHRSIAYPPRRLNSTNFDQWRISCTACCTTSCTTHQQFVQHVHEKMRPNPRHLDMLHSLLHDLSSNNFTGNRSSGAWALIRFVEGILYSLLYNVYRIVQLAQQIHTKSK